MSKILPNLNVEYGYELTPTNSCKYAIIRPSDNTPYFVRIKDGTEIDRRPLTDLNLKFVVEINPDTFLPIFLIMLDDVELFRDETDGYGFDGDILTLNGRRTKEEGINEFKKFGKVVDSGDKVLILLN